MDRLLSEILAKRQLAVDSPHTFVVASATTKDQTVQGAETANATASNCATPLNYNDTPTNTATAQTKIRFGSGAR